MKMRYTSLAGRNIREIVRDPVSMVLGMILPVVLLLLFVSMSRNAPVALFHVQTVTPGITIFSFSFLTMFSALLLSKDFQGAFMTRLMVSPLRAVDFILAYSVPFIPLALMQVIVCCGAAMIMGLHLNFQIALSSLLIFLPTAMVFIGIGMILGSWLNENQVAGTGSLVIIFSSYLGGAWMDLKMVGQVFEKVGYALPFAHAVNASRAVFAGNELASVSTGIMWITGYAVFSLVLGTLSLHMRMKKGSVFLHGQRNP